MSSEIFERALAVAYLMTKEEYKQLHQELLEKYKQLSLADMGNANSIKARLEQLEQLMGASRWTVDANGACVDVGKGVIADLLGNKNAVYLGEEITTLETLVNRLRKQDRAAIIPMLMDIFGCPYELSCELVFGGKFQQAEELLISAARTALGPSPSGMTKH